MEELQRPLAPPAFDERLRAWIAWFGFGRIVGSAIAVVVVCAGAYWLVRTPPPPTEASLPRAGTSTTVGAALPAGEGNASPAIAPAAESPADPITESTTESTTVVVHVAGAVVAPGVYGLAAGSRADDAIRAAGGVLVGADPDALNLAAPLADGSRVYVPLVGEEVPSALLPSGGSAGGSDVGDSTSTPSAPVDINRATTDELDGLPGVGPATALAIVTERERNGPFLTVDELERVPGIGPAKLEALRGLVAT